MENAVGTNRRVRFKAYELDLHTRELYRNGTRLRVQGHPIDVLEMLLENPGELVTREQLQKRLWPADTFVDFEHNLNSTIARLRDALGDRAEDPKYIETLPRLGYRFVAPVESSNGHFPVPTVTANSVGTVTRAAGLVTATAEQAATSASDSVPTTTRVRPLWPRSLAAGIVAALGITAAAWWEWWSAPSLPHVTNMEAVTHDGLRKTWLATDGSRIYFSEWVSSRLVLAQVSSTGGETSRISTPFEVGRLNDIAPDHSSLLVSEDHGDEPSPVWILPLPQGAPRRLGDVSAAIATWTPDGRQVIFARGQEVWICAFDGSQMRKLWTAPGTLRIGGDPDDLKVSPDGKHMRLSVTEPSGWTIWEVNIDGSGAHRVLLGDAGVWSPDGRYYVFGVRSGRGGYLYEDLWLLPERRGWFSRRPSAPVQLTRVPMIVTPPVAFSLDGQTLFTFGLKTASELVRYDPRTHEVVPYFSGIQAALLDFSPDGQWVTYIAWPSQILWRCKRDGSERVQLTSSTDSLAWTARWSPDSKRIAFQWAPEGASSWKLALISRDGGTTGQLISDKEDSHDQVDPTWSPDGNEIIFSREPGLAAVERMELLRLDLRTSKVGPVPGSEGLFSPRWSPDGRYLAAFSIDQRKIRIFDFQRHVWFTWFTVEEGEGALKGSIWSRDSRALYFLNRGKKSAWAWWRLGLGTQTPTKITELPDERILSFSHTLGPDGSVYFTRDRSSNEIYAIHLSEK